MRFPLARMLRGHSRVPAAAGRRRLAIEPLESRRLLDSAGYQNPDRPLDVNNDRFVVAWDALILVNYLNANLPSQLPPLGQGEVPQYYYDTDGNNFVTVNDLLQIVVRLNQGNKPATIVADLANDTGPHGVPNHDHITTDPTIAGQIIDPGPLLAFTASLNGRPETSIVNLVQPDGSFTLSPELLVQLNGGKLGDGTHELRLNTLNETGYPGTSILPFVLDHLGSVTPPPDLEASSDNGTSNTDNLTNVATPRITVAADPGSLVTLYLDGLPILEQWALPMAVFDLPTLADGDYQITALAIDGAGNVGTLSEPLEIAIRTQQPIVEMITVPFQDDLTPLIKAVVTSTPPLVNGTPIYLDVDRNNDGDYDDPDELATAAATVFDNTASIQVVSPLPDPGPLVVQSIKLRVRVSDEAGNVGVDEQSQTVSRLPSTALADYVHKVDGFYAFEDPVEITPRVPGYRAYTVRMTSQQWRTLADVDKPVWNHWLTFVVPDIVQSSTALLHITGGKNTSGRPTSLDSRLALLATATKSVVINLPQIPSEPLVFTGDSTPEREREEDEIIAYTYDQYMQNPSDGEWPLLIAMVKGAVKAMDTAQTLVLNNKFPTLPAEFTLDDFVVTGASKRGWTTWLTAAVDDRVRAIMPMVFDALNLDEQMLHHYGVYGFFSEQIKDYQEAQIFERILTPGGALLGAIVDPFHYLDNGRYEIPIYSINSAGDQFFVSDSSQYYFDDLPGTQNYLRYVPNTGHGLNEDAMIGALTFYNAILTGQHLPEFSWQVLADGSIRVATTDAPLAVNLWQATNPSARDFRAYYTDTVWTSTPLIDQGGGVYVGNVPKPASGATAFLIELIYPSGLTVPGVGSAPFKFTTHISVQTNLPLYDWLENGSVVGAPLPASLPTAGARTDEDSQPALASTAFAVSVPSAAPPDPVISTFAPPLPAAEPTVAPASAVSEHAAALDAALSSLSSTSTPEVSTGDDGHSSTIALVDLVFDDKWTDEPEDWQAWLPLV